MSKQVVRGEYTNEIVWKVPAGIDLADTETYEYGDRWGVLYITNKKTGQEWEIEASRESEHDHKRAEHLHISEAYDGEFSEEEEEEQEEEEAQDCTSYGGGCGGKKGARGMCESCNAIWEKFEKDDTPIPERWDLGVAIYAARNAK